MKLPNRLHHTAYVTKDMEATRHFYEDILGLPLVATWCESDVLFGKERTYCHCFFGIGDGGALAFFQFANKEDEELFVPDMPQTPFVHLALDVSKETQEEIERRIREHDLKDTYVLEHGYCRSVYVVDPNGMTVEFTCDDPRAAAGAEERRAKAHAELKRWLAGDWTSNNTFRSEAAA
ncbi:MAG: VOC family protein [Alteraurantiacibacter sp.]|nr:VOC family protein [Alteraurantiacibacter sp.]